MSLFTRFGPLYIQLLTFRRRRGRSAGRPGTKIQFRAANFGFQAITDIDGSDPNSSSLPRAVMGYPLATPTSARFCPSRRPRYSITLSARNRIDGGNVMPSAFAVLRLITISNLVGCWTGRSLGLAPLRILST